MSKVPGGPPATSFANPRKTGWLYKHGGSGISSHWKKRWFVADDHYLFYYKTPNDKKPVGILCLPEYGSCEKADAKEWKKSFSFILGRAEVTQNDADGGSQGGKDYVLYSDSEGDMTAWIEALQEEMKSTGTYSDGAPAGYGGSNKVKVDQKALEEVTKAASEGPKLTHLTTQRPKVKGRRPPKRYATYHEEDKDDSPPDTPTSDQSVPAASPQHTPPSPAASPTSKSKGHRPAVPLIPKQRSVTASPPPPTSGENAKSTKKLPAPPVKVTQEKEETEANVVPVPKQRPVPPKRPLKPRAATEIQTPAQTSRPVPAPRRIVVKEEVVSPVQVASPVNDVPEDKKEVEQQVDKETLVIEPGSSPATDVSDLNQEVEIVREVTVNEQEEKVEETEEGKDSLPTDVTECSPALQAEEENTSSPNVSSVNGGEDASTASEAGPLSRCLSSADEYELMKSGVTKASNQYPNKARYEEVDVSTSRPSQSKQEAEYAKPFYTTKEKETTYDIPHTKGENSVSVVSAAPQISLVASENEENLTTGRGKNPATPLNDEHLKPFKIERDALGYTKVMKQPGSNDKRVVQSESPVPSDEEPPPPPLWTGMDAGLVSNDVPSTLHQAREILRLAQVMKKEIEDMRREVQRELELARRERQDAEIIKKNATEILRMAKEKLSQKPPT